MGEPKDWAFDCVTRLPVVTSDSVGKPRQTNKGVGTVRNENL